MNYIWLNISLIVNGGWGTWSEWNTCTVSCGGADQGRTRVCDNPAPQYGGDDCTVDGSTDSESQRCNENPCQSKLSGITIIGLYTHFTKYLCLKLAKLIPKNIYLNFFVGKCDDDIEENWLESQNERYRKCPRKPGAICEPPKIGGGTVKFICTNGVWKLADQQATSGNITCVE